MQKEEKRLLRRYIAEKKRNYPQEILSKYSSLLLNKLEKHPAFTQAETILLYYSLPDEVQTHDFVEKWSWNKNIILPVVKGEELELRRYTGKQIYRKEVTALKNRRVNYLPIMKRLIWPSFLE